MKGTPSVLIGTLSGKSGGTVASNWKGRMFFRRAVVPHNPKTAAQVIQRAFMARMPACFRSLPADLVAKLNDLAAPLQLSGFNVMTRLDVKHLVAVESMSIIPPNPEANALFSAADGGSVVDKQIDIDFVAGEAIATHYVHALTCPDVPAALEPDGWTLQETPVLVSAGAYDAMVVIQSDSLYHVALVVADTNDLATATVISGGLGTLCNSGTA